MGMSTAGSREINVTPLIDVLLVLLIIFLVMMPIMLRRRRSNFRGTIPT
jgi:biopolymer transport protein ExbD